MDAVTRVEDRVSALRASIVDTVNRRLLVARLTGSQQEQDLTVPPNCAGLGRVRHFRRSHGLLWPENPLPIGPAARVLGIPPQDVMPAQLFQLAACNWDCWYCFVPKELRAGDDYLAKWVSPADLLDLYMLETGAPRVIVLSGGHPGLVPEWVPWTMEELIARGLERKVYLWSDDSLSTEASWNFLSDEHVALMEAYPSYGCVGCFKGFDAASFCFNTGQPAELFDRQFRLMARLLELRVDRYAYVTVTTPTVSSVSDSMSRFVDRLQGLDTNLPLRTVPLKIQVFAPVRENLHGDRARSLELQSVAAEAWLAELRARYSAADLARSICDVALWED